MATKKINDLTHVTSVQGADLLIVENSEGTRSIKVSDAFKNIKAEAISITLKANNWANNIENVFAQSISSSNVTHNSKVDLQPDKTILIRLINDGVLSMYAECTDGTITVFVIGAKPTVDLTIQATKVEVVSL